MITKLLGMQVKKLAALYTLIITNLTDHNGDAITDHNGDPIQVNIRE